jgi:hypothetical protein
MLLTMISSYLNGCEECLLNGPIKEEVYVEQYPSFEDDKYPSHVFKLKRRYMGLSKH